MNLRLRISTSLCRWFFAGICGSILLFAGSVAAQSTVSGTVTDLTTEKPLPGVNILVQGTTVGTTTGVDGSYELQVSSLEDTLRFSFIGYTTKSIPIQGRSTMDVQLESEAISGEELVVLGYGAQKEKDLTGSVSVIDVEEMNSLPSTQVSEKLQGQASGVTVVSSGQPGEEPEVRIRGINTFGNNQPLYVVDGVPTQNISTVNSNNIESMQVLKDASSASIYGSRASNGVVIITTKEGRGEVEVTYDGHFGYQVPPSGNVWNTLNPQEMAEAHWSAMKNSGLSQGDKDWGHVQYGDGAEPQLPYYIDPAGAAKDEVDESRYYVDPNYTNSSDLNDFVYIMRANKEGTDWFDEIYDPAGQMKHNISVSGGSETGNYMLSASYLDQQGTLMNQYLKRYNIRANTSFKISDHLRVGENLAYSVKDNPTFGTLDEGGPIGMSYREQPIIPVYDVGGNYAGTHAEGLGNAYNPVFLAYSARNNAYLNKRLFGNVFAELTLWKERLTLRTSFGGETYSGSGKSFDYPSYSRSENTSTNQFNASSTSGYNYTWTNTLTYEQSFKDVHNLTVLLGTEAYKNKGKNLSASTQDFFSFDPDFTNLTTGSGTKTNNSSRYEDALFSLFGRVDYNYDNRYLFSGTLRRDGSSKFLENQWGLFPAASVGWHITEEAFFPETSWLSDLKIRAGFGVMGNQLNVDPNNPYTLYAPSKTSTYYALGGSNGSTMLGFSQSRIGNPAAKWERDISKNIGIDASFIGGQIQLTADYYQKDIKDLLYNPSLPATAGSASQPYVNVGRMKNKGLDASLSIIGNITDELNYNAGVNFTTYNNKIVNISQDADYFGQVQNRFEGFNTVRNQVGHPVSSFYGYNIIGFWDSQQELEKANADFDVDDGESYQDGMALGRFRYEDTDGDGKITPSDRTFIGNPNPDFTYGINFGLNYKAFDFSMFWYGSQGNDIWNQVRWWTDFYPSFAGAKSKTMMYDSWTQDNHNAKAPILEKNGSFSTNEVPNSYYVEDGSYLRLKNIQLGYTIPEEVISRTGLKSLRVYVQAANLLTITNYSGPDPQIGFNSANNDPNGGGSSTSFGIDEGAYPTPRQFSIGISISY